MADPVAIISVATSGAVAIVVPFVNERLTRRRLLFEAEQRRFDDVRALLDGTLGRMGEAIACLHDFEEPHTVQELHTRWDAFTAVTDEMFRDQLRLAMRLGEDDPITRAHEEARSGFQHAQAASRRWSVTLDADAGVGESPPFQELRDDAGRRMQAFMVASKRLLGVGFGTPTRSLRRTRSRPQRGV